MQEEQQAIVLHLAIKAERTLNDKETLKWSQLKNREKTLLGLQRSFEEQLKRSGLTGFEVKIKASIIQ